MCQGTPPVDLTVALDATLWDEPTTGIGRYGHAVAGALAARGVRVLRVGARRSGELPRRMRSRTLHTLAEVRRLGVPRGGKRRSAPAPHPRGAVRAHRARPHPPDLAPDGLPGVPLAVP